MDIDIKDFHPTSLGEGVIVRDSTSTVLWDASFNSDAFLFLCLMCLFSFVCGAFVFYDDYKKLKHIKNVSNKGYKKWRHDRSI